MKLIKNNVFYNFLKLFQLQLDWSLMAKAMIS